MSDAKGTYSTARPRSTEIILESKLKCSFDGQSFNFYLNHSSGFTQGPTVFFSLVYRIYENSQHTELKTCHETKIVSRRSQYSYQCAQCAGFSAKGKRLPHPLCKHRRTSGPQFSLHARLTRKPTSASSCSSRNDSRRPYLFEIPRSVEGGPPLITKVTECAELN